MQPILRLDWTQCPDGVEIHDYGERPAPATNDRRTVLAGGLYGRWVRPRTQRRTPVQHVIQNTAEAIVLRFVRAQSDLALVNFCWTHGIPSPPTMEEIPIEELREHQQGFSLALTLRHLDASQIPAGFPGARARIVLDRGTPPTLALECDSLINLMRAEVALILASAATLSTCKHCSNPFVVGAGRGAGKRAKADYCSPKCRQAAYRARMTID
jgi:hypothetical protein